MKQNGTLLNTRLNGFSHQEIGDEHLASSAETPLREDAFEMDDDLTMELIAKHFREIMNILGLDLTADSLKGTPERVAKCSWKRISPSIRTVSIIWYRSFVKCMWDTYRTAM